jgi:cob(I)alamin adenosyltransferase
MAGLDRISTGAGDHGTSSVPGAPDLPKDDTIFELLGALDELLVAVGACRTESYGTLERRLWRLQKRISTVASVVAGVVRHPITPEACPPVSEVAEEQEAVARGLATPSAFVVPGSSRLEVLLHTARTVCRRAERRLVSATRARPDSGLEHLSSLMNRISDYLFVLALSVAPVDGSTDSA